MERMEPENSRRPKAPPKAQRLPLFVVCCHARPMQPLVMSWVALHDLERFGCVLAEMRAMVCVILCSSVARQNASVVPVCSARVAMRTQLYDCPGLDVRFIHTF